MPDRKTEGSRGKFSLPRLFRWRQQEPTARGRCGGYQLDL